MKSGQKISVVIPTPNKEKNTQMLRDCTSSLVGWFPSNVFELELIVVANAMEGFELPVNRGLRMATGDWIMILNDDVEFTGWWLTKQVQQAMNQKGVGLVNLTGYHWNDLPSYWCVLIRKECLEQVGFLDEAFGTFSSDHDHAIRIKAKGWKILHVDKPPTIVHKGMQTTRTLPNEQELIAKGKIRLFEKHGVR